MFRLFLMLIDTRKTMVEYPYGESALKTIMLMWNTFINWRFK